MGVPYDILEIVAFIKGASLRLERAAAKAHAQTVLAAKEQAIRNAKNQFKGRHGRRLCVGNLSARRNRPR